MLSRRLTALVLTLLLGVELAGCGGDSPATVKPKPAQTSLTGPGSDTAENIATGRAFIAALVANTVGSLDSAKSLVAPDSGASRYLAKRAAGTAPLTLTEPSEGRFRLCGATGRCAVISELVLVAGRVSTFKIDGKQVR